MGHTAEKEEGRLLLHMTLGSHNTPVSPLSYKQHWVLLSVFSKRENTCTYTKRMLLSQSWLSVSKGLTVAIFHSTQFFLSSWGREHGLFICIFSAPSTMPYTKQAPINIYRRMTGALVS